MSKSTPYNFSLLDTDLTNTFPTSAPRGLAGFNSNYTGLMPAGSSSSFGSGFNFNEISKLKDPMAQMFAMQIAENRYQNDPKRLAEAYKTIAPFKLQEAKEMQKLGMMSNAFASLLKDVPAAIKNYAYAGRQYDPTRINIAAQQILPASSIPNMTVNIPGRSYFS
jgi:hypothetical protein